MQEKSVATINFNWKAVVASILEAAKPAMMDLVQQEIDKLIDSLKNS